MNDLIDKEQFFKLKNEQLPWIEKHRPINIDDIINKKSYFYHIKNSILSGGKFISFKFKN